MLTCAMSLKYQARDTRYDITRIHIPEVNAQPTVLSAPVIGFRIIRGSYPRMFASLDVTNQIYLVKYNFFLYRLVELQKHESGFEYLVR